MKLSQLRKRAFVRQNGFCFYCNHQMWETGFKKKFIVATGMTNAQADRFQCTAEHLLPRHCGGKKIVAACLFCNTRRPRRRNYMTPEQYKLHVLRRLKTGKWHGFSS